MEGQVNDTGGRTGKGRCLVCGGTVRKPRRGPTPRFCSERCRSAYRRRSHLEGRLRIEEKSTSTVDDFKRRSEGYDRRSERIRDESRRMRHETSGMIGNSRLTLMTQLYVIMRNKPELIEKAPSGGFVSRLVHDIDECGERGDAEHMLRYQGYQGRVPYMK